MDDAERIRVSELYARLDAGAGRRPNTFLLDVRPAHQFDICSIPGAFNVPMSPSFVDDIDRIKERMREGGYEDVAVICRRGNQSQRALLALKAAGLEDAVDVIGGMAAWSREVDASCPIY